MFLVVFEFAKGSVLSENFHFLEVKFSTHLNRHAFLMKILFFGKKKQTKNIEMLSAEFALSILSIKGVYISVAY